MNKFSKLAIIAAAAAVVIPAPSFASEVAQEHIMCPIKFIGDADIGLWKKAIVENNGELPEGMTDVLMMIVDGECAQPNHWSKSDAQSVYGFNRAILSAVAMADKLTSLGLDPEKYEAVLENQSPADLQKILDDPNNSPALKQSLVLLIKDLGSKATVEIAADVRKYLSNAARSRLFAQELMPSSK